MAIGKGRLGGAMGRGNGEGEEAMTRGRRGGGQQGGGDREGEMGSGRLGGG